MITIAATSSRRTFQNRIKGKKILELSRSQNFSIFQIDGDGNCVFRTVAHQRDNDDENHLDYREWS